MSATKFFKDNIARIAQNDPIQWNTQRGLLAMAEMLEQQAKQIRDLQYQVQRLEQQVRR
ncbi:hypothetical protein [Herbaspirillum huttiense]|uniref:hypothetical protein n=1 Tax=Herbaspirillum huttiense TaxID=863372 RepID=UPI002E78BE4F|nr:hypothetical protein [Herbaspirillum huttiense]MEE1637178.1 hypothetical protein [Herbaspirillum huttiense NC40101]